MLPNGTHFDGEWRDDKYSGVGTINYPNGDCYQGEWKEHLPHRYGKMAYKNGRLYTGEWQLGKSMETGPCDTLMAIHMKVSGNKI